MQDRAKPAMKARRPARNARIATALAAALAISGCVEDPGPVRGTERPGESRVVATRQTAMQRAIGQCAGTIVTSAVLGALLNGGDSDSRRDGALAGALVGVGLCAVLVHVAAQEDRARVAAAEREAVRSNATRRTSFVTASGKNATVTTTVSPAPAAARPKAAAPAPTASAAGGAEAGTGVQRDAYTDCRYTKQTVTVEGQSASSDAQLWCRTPGGTYEAVQA